MYSSDLEPRVNRALDLDHTACRVYVLSVGVSQAPGVSKTVSIQVLLSVRTLTRGRSTIVRGSCIP